MKEISFGIAPLRLQSSIWEIFLVKHAKGGYWAMPKGHSNPGESPLETAKRELFEETGLYVHSLILEEPLFENYQFTRSVELIEKTVGYFIVKVSGTVSLQIEEISDGKWVTLEEAHDLITFQESKNILTKIKKTIHSIDN
ncbi:MAG: nudt2 [Chlamydiia bacterium]|nr:nudt2 [Chlamydiia bacterium]